MQQPEISLRCSDAITQVALLNFLGRVGVITETNKHVPIRLFATASPPYKINPVQFPVGIGMSIDFYNKSMRTHMPRGKAIPIIPIILITTTIVF